MTATRERQGHQLGEPIVRDEVIRLGPEGQLVGIVSHPPGVNLPGRPDRMGKTAPGPSFIILNAGVLHRVGPHRLHVALARRIAAAGMPGLRLDLGGIGDSIASSDAATFRDSAVADTRVAMTGLTEALGSVRFVLFGVCSGADNALATALVDDRVAGVVLVDPPAYPTRRGQLRDLRMRIAQRGSMLEVVRWGKQVAERRLRLAIAMLGRSAAEDPPSEGRELPPVATFGARLTTLVDRGVQILAVYSGIHGPRYNQPDQIFEVFPALRGRLDHRYYADANHTFTELEGQAELIDDVTTWTMTANRFG
jgi:pimeloyl-ACP methyl ester carboxylesterase